MLQIFPDAGTNIFPFPDLGDHLFRIKECMSYVGVLVLSSGLYTMLQCR